MCPITDAATSEMHRTAGDASHLSHFTCHLEIFFFNGKIQKVSFIYGKIVFHCILPKMRGEKKRQNSARICQVLARPTDKVFHIPAHSFLPAANTPAKLIFHSLSPGHNCTARDFTSGSIAESNLPSRSENFPGQILYHSCSSAHHRDNNAWLLRRCPINTCNCHAQ